MSDRFFPITVEVFEDYTVLRADFPYPSEKLSMGMALLLNILRWSIKTLNRFYGKEIHWGYLRDSHSMFGGWFHCVGCGSKRYGHDSKNKWIHLDMLMYDLVPPLNESAICESFHCDGWERNVYFCPKCFDRIPDCIQTYIEHPSPFNDAWRTWHIWE